MPDLPDDVYDDDFARRLDEQYAGYPARFHDHAEYLRECAGILKSEIRARKLEAIADDLDGLL